MLGAHIEVHGLGAGRYRAEPVIPRPDVRGWSAIGPSPAEGNPISARPVRTALGGERSDNTDPKRDASAGEIADWSLQLVLPEQGTAHSAA